MTVLVTALIAGQVPPPPSQESPLLLTASDGCDVPTPNHDLADTAHTPTATNLRPGQPARPILLRLARHTAADPCDTAAGRFNLVHHRTWYDNEGEQTTRDVVRWYADDDSGAELMTQHPSHGFDVIEDFWLPGWLRDRHLFPAYRSTDWLRAQSSLQTAQVNRTTQLVAGLAALATWHSPGPPQRALATQALADTTGLTAHPHTLDHAGRTGIAVAATSDNGRERHLLILHPSTGAVLAYERATLTPTGWRTRVYLLVLTRTHAPYRYWEPPDTNTPPVAFPDQREMPSRPGVWLVPAEHPCAPEREPGKESPR
ncbi:hypothetical protein O7634_12860 [Micromonospora sp. WMMD1120]|uniref:hypothetical protein n=1 Tax=Micromonospora sp. WMMD1120 TaxID=3016106 RepID=UPI00241625B7|nr:hypothetical protein [Micromonospora sp. WMMD1120]MDG4807643.1 hypothetical protein [Micromonospora sp. WMMD1120]